MTTDSYELPPMPEPDFVADRPRGIRMIDGFPIALNEPTPVFTTATLREYALLAVKGERERCAQIAERHYIHGHSIAGPAFAAKCAAAIRGA